MELTRTIRSLTRDAARRLVQEAVAHAASRDQKIAVAVVDQQGALLAFERMDGVPAPIIEFAIDKAYTAAVTGAPTKGFFDHINSSESLKLGLLSRSRLLVWSGGMPARSEDAIVGAIGVSGGPEDEDIACATAALVKAGLA